MNELIPAWSPHWTRKDGTQIAIGIWSELTVAQAEAAWFTIRETMPTWLQEENPQAELDRRNAASDLDDPSEESLQELLRQSVLDHKRAITGLGWMADNFGSNFEGEINRILADDPEYAETLKAIIALIRSRRGA